MSCSVIGIIPARYDSTRLPGKLLMDLEGQCVLERTWKQACQATVLDRVVIATGDVNIAKAAREFGADVIEVFDDFPSGSDRIARAVELMYPRDFKPDIIVNIQGDEPLLNPDAIDAVVNRLLTDDEAGVATAITPFKSRKEYLNPAAVKVVIDRNGRALYFSRAPIPHGWDGKGKTAFLHIGLYVYRRQVLEEFVKIPPCKSEQLERLEQLRLLYNGIRVVTVEVDEVGVGVDTEEDLERVREILKTHSGLE